MYTTLPKQVARHAGSRPLVTWKWRIRYSETQGGWVVQKKRVGHSVSRVRRGWITPTQITGLNEYEALDTLRSLAPKSVAEEWAHAVIQYE
jgi:transposase-like protein